MLALLPDPTWISSRGVSERQKPTGAESAEETGADTFWKLESLRLRWNERKLRKPEI